MFSVSHSYQGYWGEIKHSKAGGDAFFKGKTKGLALKYVSQGQENYYIDEHKLAVRQGQFILLPFQQPYQTSTKKRNQSNEGVCIDLNPQEFSRSFEDLEKLELLFGLVFTCGAFSDLPSLIEKLKHNNSPIGIQDVFVELRCFVQDILRLQHALSLSVKKTSTQKELLGKLFVAKNFIHNHFTQALNLKLLSKEAGISPYHLNRLFQRCFNQTPYELQLDLRMDLACKLLKQPLSLSQIALELGYNDLAAFSNQFKKYHHKTPSAYRKRI